MAEINAMSEKLISDFADKYMKKVYYFCLKKTGDRLEANDLVQDIALNIIAALNKGTIPTNFSAWIWRIARNRYSAWADSKHKNAEFIIGTDIGDYEIDDKSESALDKMIRHEQIALLRRELAFIRSEYRELIVAYYIENKSVRDIATSFSLSESAVKQRLHRTRNILKEGMNMAREFGPKSYKPENIWLNASGDLRSGLPWKATERKMQKNILLEVFNNPSSMEELAVALGISVPYMQEEVDILIRSTLLKKVGDKYVTNFPILSPDIQRKIFDTLKGRAKERAVLIANIADDSVTKIRALGCVWNGKITDEELKWWIACSVSHISSMASADFRVTPRENGERWGLVGYEESVLSLPDTGGLSNINCGDWEKVVLRHFVVHNYRIGEEVSPPYGMYDQALLLADIIRNKRNVSSLSTAEYDLWKKIDGLYAHADENGNIIPDILIFEGGGYCGDVPDLAVQIYSAHHDYERLLEIDKNMHLAIVEILKQERSPVIVEQLNFVASMADRIEGMSFAEIANTGKLTVPDDPEHCRAVIDLWIS